MRLRGPIRPAARPGARCAPGKGHKKMKNRNSFLPLYATNFFGILNDNFLKTLAGFAVTAWIPDERMKSVAMGATAAALVLPFILFSPLADRLTAVWPKRGIIRMAKWAELPIVAAAAAGFAMKSPWIVVGAVLLMGLQSSLYSPAKYALVRDIGGEGRISTGMGGMEGTAFLGVMAGTVAGAVASDMDGAAGDWVRCACLAAFALLGLAASWTVRAKETLNPALHAVNPVRYMRRVARMAKRYEGLDAVISTLSFFWWGAAMLQMGLLLYGGSRDGLGLSATGTGAMMCTAAAGIVAGQIAAGFVDRRRFLLGATIATGWIAAALLALLYFARLPPPAFAAVLGVLAFDLGFFKLPFDTEIQKRVKGPRLNTMLAYFNQVSFLYILAASGCYAAVSWAFGPRAFLLLLAAAFFAVPFLFVLRYRPAMLCAGAWIFARRYKVETEGMETVARDRPLLVLPNHPAMVDPMLVCIAFRETPLKPLADEAFFRAGMVAPRVLKTLGAVPVPDLRKRRGAKGATAARNLAGMVKDALAGGGNVIFYPSGHIQTEPGREAIGTRQLAYNVCRELPQGVRVIGVRTSGLWGSVWSRAGRTDSPPFVPTLAKSVFLWLFFAPFAPRRRVTMHVEDITDRVKEWAESTRPGFNAKLDGWYNAGADSAPENAKKPLE